MRSRASKPPLPSDDLGHILEHTRDLWEELRGNRVFITGGTGFFGAWLLESFAHANRRLGLKCRAFVLSRAPAAFRNKLPHLGGEEALEWVRGDVKTFAFPDGEFSHVIHAATESSLQMATERPLEMWDTVVCGTQHALEFAAAAKTAKFLLVSSGAVYGPQPGDMTHIPETYRGAPDIADAASSYGEGKRAAELLCAIHARQGAFETKIARCFAFVGPHLPLDTHFAIGNFIRDAIAGNEIIIRGDGTPRRSYLYASDLTIWLWTILLKAAKNRPYNVGSSNDMSIAEVASAVASTESPSPEVRVMQQPAPTPLQPDTSPPQPAPKPS